MLRIGNLLLLFALACGQVFSNNVIELDVVIRDSTLQIQRLYVLQIIDAEDRVDTLAAFDTLSFNRQNRVSLFYTVNHAGKNMLSLIDSNGERIESKSFTVSPHRIVFLTVIDQQQIAVSNKTFLYTLKNEDEKSYYAFLLIFFTVKILITALFVFLSSLRKRNVAIAAGTFLLSAFIDWLFPINYLYRLLMTMIVEYLLIAIIGRKHISKVQAAILVLFVNVFGFGMIALFYITYTFL